MEVMATTSSKVAQATTASLATVLATTSSKVSQATTASLATVEVIV